ncbi:MAG: class I SAM-dependent methyltransferase [Acidobacteria bacterium]|nr:MAG: class I SAM-dependent methyltransferase [Acidobacteriota bacterium]
MNTAARLDAAGRRQTPRLFDTACRSVVLRRLEALRDARVTLREGSVARTFGSGTADAQAAELDVVDPRFWRAVVLGGSIGAAEAYMDGWWTTPDLTRLLRAFARDAETGDRLERGTARLRLGAERLLHRLRNNSRRGARRNIAAHYDLGNEFFATFLDPSMTYSCAVFGSSDESLACAQARKYDLVCRKLGLGPDDEVLEIGCGWGGFALHAAARYGCRVVATTISARQFELARRRVGEAGLEDRVEIIRCDYRDLPRQLDRRFSRLVSIEMIEAVGHEHLGAFFERCSRMMTPDGLLLVQAIVIADQQYARYRRAVDFIQRYIFPGGALPSLTAMTAAMTAASDLRVSHVQDITEHYPRTLRRWRDAFRAAGHELARAGFDERFRRCWEFYFCYCEAGFLERNVGVVQALATRPRASVSAALPQV